MDRRDERGSLGMGPMTGRGFGPCGGGHSSRGSRFGCRSRNRAGFGRRDIYSNSDLCESYPMNEEMDRNFMKKEKAFLKARLKNINDALDELEKED